MNSDKIFYIIITLITIVLFGGILMVASKPKTETQTTSQDTPAISINEIAGTSPNTNLPIAEAKVVLVEFSDFQCSACKSVWPILTKIKQDFGTEVAVVYRQFPLTSIHNYSYNAAKASEAAAMQNKFYDYHDALFRDQRANTDPLKDEDFTSIASEVGLDIEKFMQDYVSEEIKAQVDEDVKYANSLGVNSTPTFYIDGKKVDHSKINLYDEVKRLLLEKSVEVKVGDTPVDVTVETEAK